MKCIGIGESGKDLRVKLPPLQGPVDIYIGVRIEGFNEIFFIDNNNEVVAGIAEWKANKNDNNPIDETIFTALPYGLLPFGVYDFFVMVTPTGDTSKYYLWHSYRNNNIINNNPLIQN